MGTILLVEDGQTQADACCAILGTAGHTIHVCDNAEDGYVYATESIPDLAIVDLFLNGSSGADLCKKLKANEATQLMPVLGLTASERDEDHLDFLESGIDLFLPNSVVGDDFIAAVASLLDVGSDLKRLGENAEFSETIIRGARLLIVDDSPTYLQAIESDLIDCGFQVSTVSSGEDAVRLVDSEHFDIAMIDVYLDGIDGYETAKQLRAWGHANSELIGIMMLSGNEGQDAWGRSFSSGASDFVGKSLNTQIVVAHLKNLVRRIRLLKYMQAHDRGAYLESPDADREQFDRGFAERNVESVLQLRQRISELEKENRLLRQEIGKRKTNQR